MMLTKTIGQLSGQTKRDRRRETRRFLELGGRFHPISELAADEAVEFYTMLYKKRRGGYSHSGWIR